MIAFFLGTFYLLALGSLLAYIVLTNPADDA